ncbi:hypothetical protein F5Y15DRAFT_411943 [Xylariaceae sp. FL0016]|nr:hypothetical protein F5Y15DRAFT_411943 [Xylariaceae sp. FL0016]
MFPELTRPPTQNGGSRPPTSRFQEGSMNDRASNVPPPQFLGPDQLKKYEKQFYANNEKENHNPLTKTTTRKSRRERPLSAQAHLPQQQSCIVSQQSSIDGKDGSTVTHKKSMGFFGRVRDALFNRGGAPAQTGSQAQPDAEDDPVARKHSSLQEPLKPPRPDYLQRSSQSTTAIPQVPSLNNLNGADRPSREDVLASYQELMATGFFQSHAIQSTRHAAPGGVRRSVPLMPSIPSAQCSPDVPTRVSSVNATASPGSPCHGLDAKPSFDLGRGRARARESAHMPSPTRAPPMPPPPPPPAHAHQQSVFSSPTRSPPPPPVTLLINPTPPPPELRTSESRYTLRGRKRSRQAVESDDGGSSIDSPRTSTSLIRDAALSASSSSAPSSFVEPLRRVAKKLRKTAPTSSHPSMLFSSSPSSKNSVITRSRSRSQQRSSGRHQHHHQESWAMSDANGMLAPNAQSADAVLTLTTADGSLMARTGDNTRSLRLRSPSPGTALPETGKRQQSQSQLRRTFSGASHRGEGNRLRKRSSRGLGGRKASGAGAGAGSTLKYQGQTWEMMGPPAQAGEPMSVVPDCGRGIPSVPRIPSAFQNAGGHGGDSAMDMDWQASDARGEGENF